MGTIGSKEQFTQEVQSMLHDIEQRLNDTTQANVNPTQAINDETNRLKNQHRNLEEALEKYGSVADDGWMSVQEEVQNIYNAARQTWDDYRIGATSNSWDKNNENNMIDDKDKDKYQVSTGQTDRGDAGAETGMGDRGGMEDTQGGGRVYDDSDTVNNQSEEKKMSHRKDEEEDYFNPLQEDTEDYDENIDEDGGSKVGQTEDESFSGDRNQQSAADSTTGSKEAAGTGLATGWGYGNTVTSAQDPKQAGEEPVTGDESAGMNRMDSRNPS